ncbi:3-dehydroquinate synthase [Pseudidiomarina planktonica]|uniref:3-dehydroquinate synthase n=1 Tax=Pseudidiomarina planktonica TaxID=1323738 RepID=A0A1Y6FVU2_9GAMM|nr:3-dehydroquinate synthase [Pseudidiomarina planktonica]RUO64014.1 3-dehydroquinate synthase [Pseudidiomarina planktonica]SMQ79892.1 3-dehydroquinate synthase [Pseudidiomarina planktonica]
MASHANKPLMVQLAERSYPIHIGSGLLNQISTLLPQLPPQIFILTNTTVAPLYLAQLQQSLAESATEHQVVVHQLADGEQYKSLESFAEVMNTLIGASFNRDCAVLALGGGVVGDLAGFAAACFQRGVDFYQIPTTLLADVDSSVGGKTAVNHPLGKNLIGAFYQPQAVVIDTDCLNTLTERDFHSGLAEVMKYGIIHDAEFFTWLETNAAKLVARDSAALTEAIARSCAIKAEVVALDEREQGVRALLNLGHTFGHAIEAASHYGEWTHGEAVAAGTVIASNLAMAMQLITASDFRRIVALTKALGLPVKPPQLAWDTWLSYMQRDKKVQAGKLRFVLPTAIGSATVTSQVDPELVKAAIADVS